MYIFLRQIGMDQQEAIWISMDLELEGITPQKLLQMDTHEIKELLIPMRSAHYRNRPVEEAGVNRLLGLIDEYRPRLSPNYENMYVFLRYRLEIDNAFANVLLRYLDISPRAMRSLDLDQIMSMLEPAPKGLVKILVKKLKDMYPKFKKQADIMQASTASPQCKSVRGVRPCH